MTERMKKYIEEYNKVKADSSYPVLQAKELRSIQNAIRDICSEEILTAAEAEEINSILEENLEWCD